MLKKNNKVIGSTADQQMDAFWAEYKAKLEKVKPPEPEEHDEDCDCRDCKVVRETLLFVLNSGMKITVRQQPEPSLKDRIKSTVLTVVVAGCLAYVAFQFAMRLVK